MLGNNSLNRTLPYKIIDLSNFEQEILQAEKPVLVLSIQQGSEVQEELTILESVGQMYGNAIKVCLLKEEFISAFNEKFHIIGSPTYLLFGGGREKNRILGAADLKRLTELLLAAYPNLR